MTFSYLTFIHHPLASIAFFALIMAFVSLWVHKRVWLWSSFLAIAFIFAFLAHLINLKIFIALAILGGSHLLLTHQIKGWKRIILLLVACVFSVALMGHFFPGFNNWKLFEGVQLSKNAYPYSLYLNFDKPFVGFFPLALSIPLVAGRSHLRLVMLKSILLALIGIAILTVLALYLHIAAIDLKLPKIAFIWLIANLFLTTIPEEAFFRGFLQREINNYLKTRWSGPISILAVSIIFAIFHLGYVKDLNFISMSFIASIVYGTIYQFTRAIEGSILCHYLFNVIHFFCFTYPALRLSS